MGQEKKGCTLSHTQNKIRMGKDKGLGQVLQTYSKLDFGSNQFSKIQ
jgi:hypothetical protein